MIQVAEDLPLERDRVVEEKQRGIFEHVWDILHGEVPSQETRDVGEHEGHAARQRFREDGGQSGECIVGPNLMREELPWARMKTALTESMCSLSTSMCSGA